MSRYCYRRRLRMGTIKRPNQATVERYGLQDLVLELGLECRTTPDLPAVQLRRRSSPAANLRSGHNLHPSLEKVKFYQLEDLVKELHLPCLPCGARQMPSRGQALDKWLLPAERPCVQSGSNALDC